MAQNLLAPLPTLSSFAGQTSPTQGYQQYRKTMNPADANSGFFNTIGNGIGNAASGISNAFGSAFGGNGIKTYAIGDINPGTNIAYSPTEINQLNQGALNAAKVGDMNSFDFGGAANIGLSAFDSINKWQDSKSNRAAQGLQMDALRQNMASTAKFQTDLTAAANSAFNKPKIV